MKTYFSFLSAIPAVVVSLAPAHPNFGNSRSLSAATATTTRWMTSTNNITPETDAESILQKQQRVSDDDASKLLIAAAEKFMNSQGGYFSPMSSGKKNDDPSSILADDLVFRGPVIGPLCKSDYIEVLDYFRIYEAFPDIKPNCYGFTIDPVEPLKVRFFVKATGTYQNPLGGFMGSTVAKFISSPDGRSYVGSTEAWSITFNNLQDMQVKCITAGYVVDRFEENCTTNGKGLAFGIISTIGLDLASDNGFPLTAVQSFTGSFTWSTGEKKGDALFPRAVSDEASIPKWWTDKRRGAQ